MKYYHIVLVCTLFAFVSAQEIPGTYGVPISISRESDVYVNITANNKLGPFLFISTSDEITIRISDTSFVANLFWLQMLQFASGLPPSGTALAFDTVIEGVPRFFAMSSPPLEAPNDPSKHFGMLLVRYADQLITIFEVNGDYDNNTKRFVSTPPFSGGFTAMFVLLDNSNSYAIPFPAAVTQQTYAESIACTVEEGQNKTFHFVNEGMTISVNSPSVKTLYIADKAKEPMMGAYTTWTIIPFKDADMNVSATLTWSFNATSLNESSVRFAKFDNTTNEWVTPAEGGGADMKNGKVTQTTTSLFGQWGVVSYTDPSMDTDMSSDTSTSSETSGESETEDNATFSSSTAVLNTDTVSNVSPSTTVNGDTSDEDNSSSSVLISSFAMTGMVILTLL